MINSADALRANLREIHRRIEQACERVGRDPSGVRLVAAGKTVPVELLAWAVQAGARDIGENYVKELLEKRRALMGVTWHYVGALQSHTAHRVAEGADVVHTLQPGRATARLARRAVEGGRTISCLIQVDFTGERAGTPPEGLAAFADEACELDGIEVTGLMTLPPMPKVPEDARSYHRRLREMRDQLRERHPGIVELSSGMSLDYDLAVEEGATMVRIGTALFGERAPAT